MARAYYAPIPTCPTHGSMRFDFPMDRYVCHGFDGEGCDHTVTAEWTSLGEIEGPVIAWGTEEAPLIGERQWTWRQPITGELTGENLDRLWGMVNDDTA